MQKDDSVKSASNCPFHKLFRPRSSREGIGPVKYVWWYSIYVVLQFFNRALARNPYRKVSWDKWPTYLGLLYVMAKLRYNRSNALTDPYDYAANDMKDFSGQLDAAKEHYTADGTWVSDNDNPQMGAANTRFASNIPPKKVRPDPENITPSAREVGKLRWRKIDPETGKEIVIPALILNDLAGWWIQFQVHNFEGNTHRDPVSVCPHMMARKPEDNWPGNVALIDRTAKDPTRVTDNGRPTVINERPAAWIQAQIYPITIEEEHALRTMKNGRFILDDNGNLPEDPKKPGVDRAGFNNNFNPGLSLLHWIFVQEHNSICEYYSHFHPDWDDEQLFQMAKKVNCGQIARIHTIIWTEDLLQHPTLQVGMHADWYGFLGQRLKLYLMRLSHRHPFVYKLLRPLRHNDFIWGMPGSKWEHHDGPMQVPLQFRMVYRLHEMVLGEHEILEPGTNRLLGREQLLDFVMHNTRDMVAKYGRDALAWSFVTKSAGALTLHNFPRALTRFENQQDHTLTDVAERDLFRERTDGTGTYNEFRLSVGEPPVTSFMELCGGDKEVADELSIKFEGDIDKVDAGIGILAGPKPDGFALEFCQFYQFVLNAPRRVKSNRHLSEGYTYEGYLEGMNWIEHGGGMFGVMARQLPGLKPYMEGVLRAFAPWPETETFPLRQLNKTHADTAKVFKADLRTLLLGGLCMLVAALIGCVTVKAAVLTACALAVVPVAHAFYRMLAMRFMQQAWKKCYTDKRSFMFGTLYKAEKWINLSAFLGSLQSLVVLGGFGYLGWTLHSAHPIVAVLAAIAALSGLTTRRWSRTFAQDAQVLKTALRNRMRQGQPVHMTKPGRSSYCFDGVNTSNGAVDMDAFETMFRRYAPGRDYMTAYDFARMHEGNRIAAFREGRGNCVSRLVRQALAQHRTRRFMRLFADRVVEEDRSLVPAVSKEMFLRVCQGLAELDLAGEQNRGDCQMQASGLGWRERFEGGSAQAEEAMIRGWMIDIQQIQRKNEQAAHAGKPSRAFHAQSRAGIVNAEFRVSADIPEYLLVGGAKPGGVYKVPKTRFSNASGTPKADTEKDLRGLAFEVELPDGLVDFLMTNAPASHARNAKQFIQFAQAGAAGKLLMIPKLIASVGLFEAIRILKTVIRQSSRPVESLAEEAYWSRSPYGFNDHALKYATFPADSQKVSVPRGPNFLREDLIERLKLGPITFDYKVQLFANERLTPIEDGTVEWKETDSPFTTVAQLYIPQQDLTSAEAQAAEKEIEQYAFNPWRTVKNIVPLGGLNRARKMVYLASSSFRGASK